MTDRAKPRGGPLDGLRVVDFSGMISGGFATCQLADFGADVVMVEHPEYPDPLREWPPFEEGTSLWWKSIGRNKRCVTLDLKSEAGSALALELVSDADVVFENFRPGTMERWGLGPNALFEANPEAIVVRLSGYGQTGPRSSKPGFGTVAEGISGWASVNGFPDREPLLPPISLADLTAAQFAVQATMFAVYERDLGRGGSGEGQVVDVSLYEPLFRLFVGDVEGYDKQGIVRERTGNRHPNAVPRNVYETADGHLTLSASSQRIFENVMRAIGRPDLVDDPRFSTNERRVENADELDAIIEAWTRERPTDEAIEVMEESDAIVGPVYDMGDIFEDEQYRARGDIVEVEDDEVGRLRTAAPIPKFSRTPGAVTHAGPRHGQHDEEVFRGELGLDADEFERLRAEGVVR
ncbi:CaiB/BaiF CoA transferase family protein [Halegenticoccus soli]|uniref:CaiB/BaiF CoA transferase family protein n=1 Tax=Halegenticoccus soli TaxID=1985678 RepID=UPI000C6D2B92|nr:CoA transferase [Halegenticoccus soli]